MLALPRSLRPFCLSLGVLLIAGLASALPLRAQSDANTSPVDSTRAQDASGDWLLLPFLAYEPKTKMSAGVVAGYYRPNRPGRIPSSVQTGVTLTQERQVIIQVEPEIYLQGGRYRIAGEAIGSRFPDQFFGIGGDTSDRLTEDFTSRYLTIEATAQRRIDTRSEASTLQVGPRVFSRIESVTEVEAGRALNTGRVAGADGGTTTGLGGGMLLEARDNIYYPRHGHFAEVAVLWHSAVIGSDFTFGRLRADLRGYRSAGPVVVAGNVYVESVAGTPPFQLLPLLGGSDRMRGYREGRYRDNVYWATQAEVRVPLFWRFGATAFAGAGEVGPRFGQELVENVQVAAGLGGRLRLNDEGVHGRVDLAYGANGLELYLSLLEAF